jgi:hypothetical protein
VKMAAKHVTTISLRSLHCSLGTVVSIVSQLSTLEAPIGLNRSSVSNRCPRAIIETTLLRSRSSGCLWVEALWLKRSLQLHVSVGTSHFDHQDGTDTDSAEN